MELFNRLPIESLSKVSRLRHITCLLNPGLNSNCLIVKKAVGLWGLGIGEGEMLGSFSEFFSDRRRFRPALIAALWGALFASMQLVTACNFSGMGFEKRSVTYDNSSENSEKGGTLSGFQTFKGTFYVFSAANCALCHGTQKPQFATATAESSYANAKNYADFNAPSKSRLVLYAGNGHCGLSNCTGPAQSADALEAVTLWANAELGSRQPAGTPTPVPLPTLAPTPTPTPPTPTPAPTQNIALGKAVTVSSGTDAATLTDGLLTTNSRWFSDPGYPQWAEIDLGGTYTLSSVSMRQFAERVNAYIVEVQTQAGWVKVAEGTGNQNLDIRNSFTPVSAKKVKFTITAGDDYIKMYELEVFGTNSSNPTPVPNPTPSGGISNSPGFQAFKGSFYLFATNNCAQCHGALQTPQFAIANAESAYANAKAQPLNPGDLRLADFNSPADSLLVLYAGNRHCQLANCTGTTQSSAALAALIVWANAELGPRPLPTVTPSPTPSSKPSPAPSAKPSPAVTSTPTPTPTATITPTPEPTSNGGPSTHVPTTEAVFARIRKGLPSLKPYESNSSNLYNFIGAYSAFKGNLPISTDMNEASGFDVVAMIVLGACADEIQNLDLYGIKKKTAPSAQVDALVRAGVTMVNTHVAGLASAGELNQKVTAVFLNLVNARIADGSDTARTFIAVCAAANTFGATMTGF
jgi:mono/diheme cytochrome c family protein